MRKNTQIVVDKENGDCMRACLTSMLDLPNDPSIVPIGGPNNFHIETWRFLQEFGLYLAYEQTACWTHGLWMASVKSLNYPGEATHAIVMHDSEVVWDPSSKLKYKEGESLLGKDVVLGGHHLRVSDPTLLYKLVDFQRAHAQ